MRKGKEKVTKWYWLCENKKCNRMLTTDQESVRRRCECRMFMKELTKEEHEQKRLERTGHNAMPKEEIRIDKRYCKTCFDGDENGGKGENCLVCAGSPWKIGWRPAKAEIP